MSAFNKAWLFLKALPEQQFISPPYSHEAMMGEPYSRIDTMHPAALGMARRQQEKSPVGSVKVQRVNHPDTMPYVDASDPKHPNHKYQNLYHPVHGDLPLGLEGTKSPGYDGDEYRRSDEFNRELKQRQQAREEFWLENPREPSRESDWHWVDRSDPANRTAEDEKSADEWERRRLMDRGDEYYDDMQKPDDFTTGNMAPNSPWEGELPWKAKKPRNWGDNVGTQ